MRGVKLSALLSRPKESERNLLQLNKFLNENESWEARHVMIGVLGDDGLVHVSH
jgi:hypothetical protein